MLFVEARFFLFFIIVFGVYWALRTNGARKVFLLLTSYLFYGLWDWRFLLLLIASTLVDYLSSLYIDRTANAARRRWALWLSIAFNLGVLGFFKYYGFFAEQLQALLGLFGVSAGQTTLAIVLPVGISFYTFQTMSYTIDVYRRQLRARASLLDIAVFVAFFPQLVAGPIVRAGAFLPQLDGRKRFADVDARRAVLLCLVGYFKKAVVADGVAPFIDPVWAHPAAYDWPTVVAAQLLFLVQIFCDFSGYSDIAVGTAALLGYSLPRNFRAPLLARNIIEGWQRWHITLANWFRDYVFFPILRYRHDIVAVSVALVLVMALIGFWHGAKWTFITWGAAEGVGLALLGIARRHDRKGRWRLPYPVALALSISYTALVATFFRAPDMRLAFDVLAIDFAGATGATALGAAPFVAFGALGALHWSWNRYRLEDRVAAMRPPLLAAGFGVAFALCFALTPRVIKPFIYFQF
jgi:D-alanyl-lipoteichoic acid acyltransferase DltB (MBOAT superfamily)